MILRCRYAVDNMNNSTKLIITNKSTDGGVKSIYRRRREVALELNGIRMNKIKGANLEVLV